MIQRRLRIQFFFVVILLGALGARLFTIQILQSLAYAERARQQFQKAVQRESRRGDILDRNGHLLATTVESASVYVHPDEVSEPRAAARLLAQALRLDAVQVERKIRSNERFVWVDRKCNPSQIELIARSGLTGIGWMPEQKRYYPNGSLACHLLGFTGLDNTGLAGIEQTLESVLKGRVVLSRLLRDGKGRRLDLERNPSPASQADPSVRLTLDRSLQYIAETELEAGLARFGAQSGMIVIQDPHTGEILACAAAPGYDPNALAQADGSVQIEKNLLKNPIVQKVFEPGSTFKIVTLSAALNEKIFRPQDPVECENGNWRVSGITLHDHEPSGRISFEQVMERSSNIGTAKIGIKLGKERLYRYARAFGFGTRTGAPLPGETEGLFRPPSRWSATSLPILSFGQEIGVTALQLIGSYSALANGGVLVEPVLIRDGDEREKKKGFRWAEGRADPLAGARIVRRVLREEVAAEMRRILRDVVERGTGQKAKVSGYSVAGKTGTAQKTDPLTGKYDPNKYTASFCGFLPADRPALVCLVVLDEPKTTSWGGETAAPIFARVMARAVQILAIPQDPTGTVAAKPQAGKSPPLLIASGRSE